MGKNWPRKAAKNKMSYSEKTVKMLWGRAASRCAICRMELVMERTTATTNQSSVILLISLPETKTARPDRDPLLPSRQKNGNATRF